MKSKFLKLLGAVAIVFAVVASVSIATVVVSTEKAHASLPSSTCPTWSQGQVVGCFFKDTDGNGSVWYVTTSQGCKNFSSSWNDVVSSWQNHAGSGYRLQVWENANCSGASLWKNPGQSGTMNFVWNDEASSYAVYPGY